MDPEKHVFELVPLVLKGNTEAIQVLGPLEREELFDAVLNDRLDLSLIHTLSLHRRVMCPKSSLGSIKP
jgi:hypothetical protein